MALSDDKGNRCVVDGVTNLRAERLAPAVTIQMGCAAAMALYPMTGDQVEGRTIRGSLTRAWRLGTELERARSRDEDPTACVAAELDGHVLLVGKVVDIARKIEKGFTTTEIDIEGLGDDTCRIMHVITQNEHLIALIDGEVVATVPDLARARIRVGQSGADRADQVRPPRHGHRRAVRRVLADTAWTRDNRPALLRLAYVASWLADAGSTFNLEEAAPGRPNVFALGRGTGSGRSLILNAHLDTVGTQEMTDPLVPRIEDGRFYGRSAFDMKAALPPS